MTNTLVFDLDGTLVDTAPDLVGTLNAIMADEGIAPLTLDEARHAVGSGARVMIERAIALGGEKPGNHDIDRLFDVFVQRYEARIAEESAPYPGAVAALDAFARAGWRLAICTNKLEGLAQRLMAELGLDERFAAICGQDTFAQRKPDPRALTGTIARAGGDRTRAVMVGDSITDVKTAKAAQVPVVVVSFGYAASPPADLGGDRLIDHFDELWDAVAAVAPASALS